MAIKRSKRRDALSLYHYYREASGVVEADLDRFIDFALKEGWPLPPPQDPRDRLKQYFTQVIREEIKHDPVTGKPYRVNHAVPHKMPGQPTLYGWIDIDNAPPRESMWKALVLRREQMLDDGVAIRYDEGHWNRVNPDQEQIHLPMDLDEEIEWKLNAPDEKDEAT